MDQSVAELAEYAPATTQILPSLRELAAEMDDTELVRRVLAREFRTGHVEVAAFNSAI